MFSSLPVRIFLCIAVALSCFGFFSFSNSTTNGADVVTAMYNKWQGKWYRNFAFEQKAIFYKQNKITKTETWQEILSSPGNLHIRFNGFDTQNGAIYSQDSVYHYQAGVLQSKKKRD